MAETTPQEQLILEMINRARMNPLGEAQRYGIDLNAGLAAGTITATPKQVLAANPKLNDSADAHSTWMLDTDTFNHTGVNGSTPGARMTSAGYVFSGSWTWGENIAWTGTTGTLDANAAAAQHHQNLFLSAGHRVNILKDSFREIGVGSVPGKMTSGSNTYNALMTTQNFAASGSNFFVTGVVFNDGNGDDFYTIGEGLGGRTVTLLQNNAVIGTSASGTAGGYALGTAVTGDVEVRFSGTGLAAPMGAMVNMAGRNVKVDLVDGNTIFSNVSATLTQQAVGLQLIGIDNVNATGNALANVITGNAGNNTLSGGDGNDTMTGGSGADTFTGGDGDDVVHAASNDNLALSFGGAGLDKIYITGSLPAGFDYAANGFEELWVNGVLVASTGAGGGTEPGEITGTEADDSLTGTDDGDVMRGLGGNDRLNGGTGADWMHGNAGSDIYYVNDAGDIADETGGSGNDRIVSEISFSLADAAVVKGSIEKLTLAGTAAIDGTGNGLNNAITGNNAVNRLSGGDGHDTLSGGGGKDLLSGGSGNDKLNGGSGQDRLIGGTGADQFVFSSAAEANGDTISDFKPGTDRINLSSLDAQAGGSDDAFTFNGMNGLGAAGDLSYRHTATQTIVEGDVNGDGIADFAIVLTGIHTLNAADFIL